MTPPDLNWARPDPDAYALGVASVPAWRFDPAGPHEVIDALIEEVPVQLNYPGQTAIVMMATPLQIEAFALGFTLTEGIAERADQVLGIDAVPANGGFHVAIELAPELAARVAARQRVSVGTSGCGVCGVAEVTQALRLPAMIQMGQVFTTAAVAKAMAAVPALQTLGRQTGSAHAVAFASPEGALLAFAEDVGRHNALDKLVGLCAQQGLDPAQGFCVTTSRASYEMAQKAASAGFPMLCAMSGATAQARRLALACGLTLCAFARRDTFVCLSVPQRLRADVAAPDA